MVYDLCSSSDLDYKIDHPNLRRKDNPKICCKSHERNRDEAYIDHINDLPILNGIWNEKKQKKIYKKKLNSDLESESKSESE